MVTIKIREIAEFRLPIGNGKSELFNLVRYRTDDGRSGTVRVPKKGFNQEKAIAAIQLELEKPIDPLVGQEIEVE